MSVMIEVNRALYMNEKTGRKNNNYGEVKRVIGSIIKKINTILMRNSA